MQRGAQQRTAHLRPCYATAAAHWNNVENAPLVEFERTRERYEPTVHSLMSFFML